MRILVFVLGSLLARASLLAQDIDPGRRLFENRCATCHGADGNGGPMGPPITSRLATREAQQLAALIREGLPARGMPPSQLADPEMDYLVRFLRTIQQRALDKPVVHMTVQTIDGKTLVGQVLGEGFEDLQLRTDDKRIHLLRRAGDLFREVTSETNWPQNYFATSAPLPAGSLVISGVAGGEHGAKGFVTAIDQDTGKEAWRFWSVPKRGEPGSETWKGKDLDHGGAPTWFTGSYDPELDLVYWPTGNPSEEYNGDHRKGDNLYSDSMVALDRQTGKLK